jgi:hypothetical protein
MPGNFSSMSMHFLITPSYYITFSSSFISRFIYHLSSQINECGVVPSLSMPCNFSSMSMHFIITPSYCITISSSFISCFIYHLSSSFFPEIISNYWMWTPPLSQCLSIFHPCRPLPNPLTQSYLILCCTISLFFLFELSQI